MFKFLRASPENAFLFGFAGAALIRLFACFLILVISVILARSLGPDQYGQFVYITSWCVMLGIIAQFGLSEFLTKEVSAGLALQDWPSLQGVIRTGFGLALGVSIATALIAASVVALFPPDIMPLRREFYIALLQLPAMAVIAVLAGTLIGLHHVLWAQLITAVISPLFFLLTVSLLWWCTGGTITIAQAIWIGVISAVLAVGLLWPSVSCKFPYPARGQRPKYSFRKWFRQAAYLCSSGILTLAIQRTDLLMLGAIRGTDDVGIYNAACRIAEVSLFPHLVLSSILGPTFSSMWARKQLTQLRIRASRMAWLLVALTIPIAIGLVLFAGSVLSLFGPEYTAGLSVTRLLVGIHLLTVLAGLASLLLIATGNGSTIASAFGLALACNIAMNAILIPTYGVMGAALGTGLSLLILNVILVFRLWRKTAINSSVFGASRPHEAD